MDSFYDAPRQPPVPTTINRIEKAPMVPEVSVVDNSFFNRPKFFTPFDNGSTIRPRANIDNSLIYQHHKKQVRFESPSTRTACPYATFKPIPSNCDKENIPQPLKTVPDLNGKTFKQIYMANVPDRHLDLSVFESSFKETRPIPENNILQQPQSQTLSTENVKFDTHCNYFGTNKLKSIENTSHIQYMSPFYQEKERRRIENENAVGTCQEIAKPNDDKPTIKDLFKIIQQQNEQIMLLQRQVNNLKHSIRQPENPPLQFDKPQDHPFMKEIANSPSKKGMFSFDVKATSFEVSFRPQHGKLRNQNNFLEPKIQEITECDNSKDNEDISLHLEESLNLKESYLSTVPSIHINMDEYQSSEEDEESGSPGVTFYKDLMDQVNNVLKKMQVQSECHVANNKKKTNNVSGHTMKAVKQATLQHLKSIGVNLSPIQETNEISNQNSLDYKNYDSSEVSFAVKQLLMKYLPDDKLTQAINKPKDKPLGSLKEKKCKPGKAEFSFATLQYMKKYNLIDNGKKFPEFEKKKVTPTMTDNPKILDVTALKLQPKLL